MVKFKTNNKGRITQGFGGNPAIYKSRGAVGHPGIDTFNGWNTRFVSDNDGYVYKTIERHQSKEGWQGVYMLVQDGDDFVEVCHGHFNTILVKAGDQVLEGQGVGLEGNKGYVISGGTVITPAMQDAGDQRGAHTHTSFRPVRRVKRVNSKRFYLQTAEGVAYKDQDGFYYEIINQDNGSRGCVDPMLYHHQNSIMENITAIRRLLTTFKR